MSSKDNPTSAAGKSRATTDNPGGTAGRNSPDTSVTDTHTAGTNWAELDDRDLHNAAVDRGITVNDKSRDELVGMLQAYDRDGTQGADAPASNHPATIEERAKEDEKRRERAQNG